MARVEKAAQPAKKYELVKTDTVKSWDGRTLYRIRALIAIAALGVSPGDLGGYVEKEENLSARVSDTAWVSGSARVFGSAQVSGTARVSPINITDLTWNVTIADTQMAIGCQTHDLSAWEAFTAAEIAEMDPQALTFWQAHKGLLLGLAKANGRPVAALTDQAPAHD